MTRKQRAAPQSAPPKGQTAPPTRETFCEARREHGRGETEDGAGLQRPNTSAGGAPRHMEVGRGEGEIQ